MKVLYITHCTGMAGANRSMLQLIRELREVYAVEPFVLLPHDEGDGISLKVYLKRENINFKEVKVPYFKQGDRSRKCRLQFYEDFHEIDKELAALKDLHFDLIHSNSSVIDIGGYISRKIGVRHIWHLRDFGELDYNLSSIWGYLYEKLSYRNGDVFIAISSVIKDYFERVIPASKIQIIYNGIKQKDNLPIALHDSEDVKFLCAGVICDAKNQMEIIHAVNLLVNERAITNLHLYLAGIQDSDYVNQLLLTIKQNYLEQYVTILGEVDGIESLAATMDVGIMSSRCEAFGRVTVEYMFQNLAVIANDSGANPEIIRDGETGLIYKQNNVESLADKMQVCIENRNLLKEIAVKGKKDALIKYQSNKNARHVYDLYNQLLAQPNRAKYRINFANGLLNILHFKDLIARMIK